MVSLRYLCTATCFLHVINIFFWHTRTTIIGNRNLFFGIRANRKSETTVCNLAFTHKMILMRKNTVRWRCLIGTLDIVLIELVNQLPLLWYNYYYFLTSNTSLLLLPVQLVLLVVNVFGKCFIWTLILLSDEYANYLFLTVTSLVLVTIALLLNTYGEHGK